MLAVSHTEMTGGSYRFDVDQETSFVKGYAKRTKMRNQRLTWVERTTQPHFNMFFDLDIKDTLNYDQIMEIGASIVRILDIRKRWLISSPGATPTKTGIHLNCPHKVDKNEATALADRVKEACVDIAESIDTVPYKNGGLRMLWSTKANGSPAYVPLGEWDWDSDTWEPIHVDTCDRVELLQTFTIRYVNEGPQKASYSKLIVNRGMGQKGEEPGVDLAARLEKEIMFKWPAVGCLRVQELKKFEETNSILVKTDSKYCLNKGGCHSGNHVFFIIKVESGYWTIHQRCNSDHGTCAEYRGDKRSLSTSVVKHLKQSGIL